MEDWKEVTLADCVSLLGDGLHGTPKYSENGEYAFINGNNLIDGKILIKSDTKRVDEVEYQKYKKNLTERTILVSINGTLGNVGTYNNEKVILGKSACYFNVKNDIDKNYIKYIVSSKLFRDYLENNATGTTIKNVSLAQMRNYKFTLPPLPTQQKIAQILSSLDDKIELNNKINTNLEQQAQALFKNWFVDFEPFGGEMPAGWKVGKLSEIIDIRDGTHDSPKFYDEGYPLVTSKHLDSFKINFSDMKYITEADYEKINERSKVDTGDILYSMIGTVGIISLVIDNPVQFAIKNVGLFKTSQNPVYKFFVLNYLKTQEIKNYIEQHLARSTQKYISLSELRNIPLYIPDTNILEKFNSLVEPITNGIINNVEENNRLSNLRDTLLPKLMNGEIEI